jgi:hypothetical protein
LSPDPDLIELLRSRAQVEITTYTSTDANDLVNDDGMPASDAEEAELILFAAPSLAASTTAPQIHKIRLTSPEVETDGSGFVRKKPRSYYFADDVDRVKEEYQSVAVTAGMVHELSQIPWPGCVLPWKVRTISCAGLNEAVKSKKKTRKGKKTRIAIRKGIKAKESKNEEDERAKMVVDEQEREKRVRRNREKKLKKREREKAKKAAGANVVGDVPGDESD